MNIVYDLETSGLSTKHQILTACFIITNDAFEIDNVYNFRVALNPLEIPAESAIAVNAVDITQHMLHHKNKFDDLITEEEFARRLNNLLSTLLSSGAALIGYNSNKFDIKHLRKVLIKWGYNPYYNYNKFPMVDIYNHIKFLKLSKPKAFEGMENLKLGTVYKQLYGESAGTLHEAEADVHHCIDIAKFLLEKYGWDIVKENHKVNNLSTLDLRPGDVVALANPHNSKFEKCIVHDVTDTYVLMEKLNAEPEDYKFINIHKNDFAIAKKIDSSSLPQPVSINKYFASFDKEGERGVEEFVYHIGFKDFIALSGEDNEISLINKTHLDQLLNSQAFTRIRPIKHTTDGLEVGILSTAEKNFLKFYFTKYGMGENDVSDVKNENEDKVKLIKEYKAAYKELYAIVSATLG